METLIGRLLETLGRNSIQAGVLVLVVLLTQRCLGTRIAARWRCALWLLVMGRLLLPVSIGSGVSLFNCFRPLGNPPPMASPPARPEVKPLVVPVSLAAPAAEALPRLDREAPPQTTPIMNPAADSRVSPSPGLAKPESKPAAPAGVRFSITWPIALFAAWLAGVLCLGGCVAVGSIRMHRRFAKLAPLTDPDLLGSLRDYRQALGVGIELPLAESPDVATPALYGFMRPRLLLPNGFMDRFSANERRFILLHELAHVKRRDILFNWLVAGLQMVHWFNPLIWVGFARWRADRELACDELALEAAGPGHNREYGETILRLLESFTPRAAVPGLIGILEDKRQLRRRLRTIGGFRPGRKLGILSAALFAGLGLVCLTDAQLSKPQTTPEPKGVLATNDHPAPTNEVRRGADPAATTEDSKIPAKTMTITVTDAQTGQPLADAELRAPYVATGAWNQPQPTRLTDAQGRYALRIPMPPGSGAGDGSMFTVSASHRNYAGRTVGWTSQSGNVLETLPGAAIIKLKPGITVGGVVRDERRAPLAAVRVVLTGSGFRGFANGKDKTSPEDYPEISRNSKEHPVAVTDAEGRWTVAHFPADLNPLEVTLIRPDDAQESFSTTTESGGFGGFHRTTPVSMADLRATNADLVLSDGITVPGLVVDESGRPLPGVDITEGYGQVNIVRVSAFRTDARGRFMRFHRAPRQWIYTASTAGRATTSVVAQVEPQMPEVRIVMAPAKPLKIRLADDSGKPVAGVGITILSYRTEAQILDWQAETDAEGLAIWSNAPTSTVTFQALSKAYGERQFKASAADGEKIVVLSEGGVREATVQVSASDAKTGAPVDLQSVAVAYQYDSTFKTLSRPNAANSMVKIKAGNFHPGNMRTYTIRVEADGYEPRVSDYLDFSEGDQKLAVALIPSGPARGVAFFPDGRPAAGARVWVRSVENSGAALFCNAPGQYYGDALGKTVVKEDGTFTLPIAPRTASTVFTSEKGFLETTLAEIQRAHEVRLRPWGRVEGVLKIAGQAKGGVYVTLSTLLWTPALGFHLMYGTSTAPDGRFEFTQVPAGEYHLSRQPAMRSGRSSTADHQWPLVVQAGETTTIEYGNPGRAVMGQAAPDQPELAVDWLNDDHTLTLKQPAIAAAYSEDFATRRAFELARDHAYQSPERLRQAREARTYVLGFERDGSFRAEDVPPGTYQLSIRVTQPDPDHRFNSLTGPGKELGSFSREVVVPPGDAPLDLGTLVVAMKDEGNKLAPVNFKAQTLDGQPVSLAQFKGKYVVLAFWGLWSDRSTRQLADLLKLPPEVRQDKRLEFVGACVDDDAAAVRKAAEARGYPWTQTWLNPANLAQTTASFDVSLLPAIYLLDLNGRIIARDLDADRLVATILRVLAK